MGANKDEPFGTIGAKDPRPQIKEQRPKMEENFDLHPPFKTVGLV